MLLLQLSGFKSLVGAASSTTETFAPLDSKTFIATELVLLAHGNMLKLLPGKTISTVSQGLTGSIQIRHYTTNVTTNGTAGSSGAYTEILVTF